MPDQPSFDITRSTALEGVAHGFFGHSDGAYQFGYGGDGAQSEISAVRQNAAQAILAGGKLVTPHQTHSADVIVVDDGWDDCAIGRPEADALVTATPGLVLGIVTADCASVLLADLQAGIVGAAHAGWRGAVGGVLENTVDAMVKLGANTNAISAAIGPTIAQPSYEVDDGFRSRFAADDARFFASGRQGHWQFDLPNFIVHRLRGIGVCKIADLALDTYALENRYYSYRRATHRSEPNYGRHISMIGVS
ncbi:Laccase domain protein [Altererythrobacter insulae]|nr:Laccase domain protein [Altererythrobacter insulae]